MFSSNLSLYFNAWFKVGGFVVILLTFLFFRLILEKRNYPSADNGRLYIFQIISVLLSFLFGYLFVYLFGIEYLGYNISLNFILRINLLYYNFIILSIGIFEFFYCFLYLENKFKMYLLIPYLVVYGYVIFNTLVLVKLGANFVVLTVLLFVFFTNLFKLVKNNNDVMKY